MHFAAGNVPKKYMYIQNGKVSKICLMNVFYFYKDSFYLYSIFLSIELDLEGSGTVDYLVNITQLWLGSVAVQCTFHSVHISKEMRIKQTEFL